MLSFIRLDKKPYCWFINQAHRKFLETTLIGKEDTVYQAVSAGAFKDNSARTIFTMDLPGQPDLPGGQAEMNLVVKHYKITNWLEMLKATFISKARQEVRAAAHLIQQHVNTVYPLGVLEKRRYGFTTEVFVFLRKINDVVSLKEFLAQPLPMKTKDNLLKVLGEFIRKIHQARFFHKDLHIGNILINTKTLKSETPDLYLIDLHRSAILPHATQSHGIYNLAQMVYSLSTVLPLTDAYRFVKYYRELDFRKKMVRDFTKTVFRMADDLRHKHWHSRNKRCLKNSSAYAIAKIKDAGAKRWHKRAFIDKRFNLNDILGFVDRHNGLVLGEPKKLFKSTLKRLISRIPYPELGKDRDSESRISSSVFVKEYRYSFWTRLLSFLKTHPAKDEWFAMNGLITRGVKTVVPLALVEEYDPFYTWINRAYLITREAEARSTNNFLMKHFIQPIKDHEALHNKTLFIKDLAMAIKEIHQKGIFHHDFKANNILIANSKPQSSFYLIDLDRVDFDRETTLDERILNLAQLNAAVPDVITKSDRLRFYRFYSYGVACLPHKDEKDLITQIMQATGKRRHFWPMQR